MVYEIVQAHSDEKLLELVESLNKKGWEACGGVNVHFNPDNPETEREVYTLLLVKEGSRSRWNLV